jgi:hypothetical protein
MSSKETASEHPNIGGGLRESLKKRIGQVGISMGGLNDGPTAEVFFISTIILKQVLRNYRLYLRGSKGEAI